MCSRYVERTRDFSDDRKRRGNYKIDHMTIQPEREPQLSSVLPPKSARQSPDKHRTLVGFFYRSDPVRTAVPLRGQTTQNVSSSSPKQDYCSPKWVSQTTLGPETTGAQSFPRRNRSSTDRSDRSYSARRALRQRQHCSAKIFSEEQGSLD